MAVGLCWTAAKVAAPRLVGLAIDNGIEARDQDAVLAWAAAIAVTAVVAATFTGLRRWWAFRESRWAEAQLRDRMFAHIQRLHFAFHDRTQTGELMSRANTDLQQIQNFVVLIPLTISNAVTVLAVTVILVRIDPFLTLLALGVASPAQRSRQAVLHTPASRSDGHPGRVGPAGQRSWRRPSRASGW